SCRSRCPDRHRMRMSVRAWDRLAPRPCSGGGAWPSPAVCWGRSFCPGQPRAAPGPHARSNAWPGQAGWPEHGHYGYWQDSPGVSRTARALAKDLPCLRPARPPTASKVEYEEGPVPLDTSAMVGVGTGRSEGLISREENVTTDDCPNRLT